MENKSIRFVYGKAINEEMFIESEPSGGAIGKLLLAKRLEMQSLVKASFPAEHSFPLPFIV